MASSADIALLTKLNELKQRYGLRGTDAEAWFHYINSENDPEGQGYFYLEFSGQPADPEKAEKLYHVRAALGMKGYDQRFDMPSELEDLLDRALSLAPRARVR